jgi:hypothetical protein
MAELQKWLGDGFTVAPGPLPETQCAKVIINHLSNGEDEEAVNDEIKREVEFDMSILIKETN